MFYSLSTLHKDPIKGRPIVTSRAWPFMPQSQWIAHHLNKVLEFRDIVLASTVSIFTELRAFATPHDGDAVYLVTADVLDMYDIIPVDQASLAVGSMLLHRNFSPQLAAAITEALELVMDNNYFSFDGGTYSQTAGIAMAHRVLRP